MNWEEKKKEEEYIKSVKTHDKIMLAVEKVGIILAIVFFILLFVGAPIAAYTNAVNHHKLLEQQKDVEMHNCTKLCVEGQLSQYMKKIYGTSDNYVSQFKAICEIRAEGRKCVVDGTGTYKLVEKR